MSAYDANPLFRGGFSSLLDTSPAKDQQQANGKILTLRPTLPEDYAIYLAIQSLVCDDHATQSFLYTPTDVRAMTSCFATFTLVPKSGHDAGEILARAMTELRRILFEAVATATPHTM